LTRLKRWGEAMLGLRTYYAIPSKLEDQRSRLRTFSFHLGNETADPRGFVSGSSRTGRPVNMIFSQTESPDWIAMLGAGKSFPIAPVSRSRLLGFVSQVRRAILHLGHFGVSIVRIQPFLIGGLLLPLPIHAPHRAVFGGVDAGLRCQPPQVGGPAKPAVSSGDVGEG
jgi:hypothetical protein